MLITQIFVLGGNRTHDLWLSSQGLQPLDQQASQSMRGYNYYVGNYYVATVREVVERTSAALRVVGSIPVRNKYFYGLHLVVVAVCVCDVSMFVNELMIQHKFVAWERLH